MPISALVICDMDFAVAEPIVDALRDRLDHAVFGYGGPVTRALRELIAADMQDLYGWTVSPADIVFLPGVVPGFNQTLKAVTRPGDRLVVEISDNGRGLPPPNRTGKSIGMLSMAERARELQGCLEIGNHPAGGTRLVLRVPMEEQP